VGKFEGKRQLGKPRRRFEDSMKLDVQEVGLDRSVSVLGQVAVTCECGNEPLGSIKCEKFLDQLRKCYILKKDSASWNK
jgi:hypothetical protein